MRRTLGRTRGVCGGLAIGAALWGAPALAPPALGQTSPKQLSPDDAAMIELNTARRAFNEQKYPFAADRFKEFLAAHGGHPEATSAWYGLGLSIVSSPQPDYLGAVEALQRVIANPAFPDRPLALYYLGAAQRGIGNRFEADAAAKPNEAEQLHRNAAQRFEEAAKQFAAAQMAFAERTKTPPTPDAAELPADLEWSARARCDAGEMLLRVGKYKETVETSTPFMADPILARSRYRPLGLYHLGHGQFVQKDYLAAGRALSLLAPFQQDFGVHARYLLARIHHLSDERPEAAAQYKAVLDGYEAQKKNAQQLLQNPAALDPERKLALEAVVNGPAPDYVVRTGFYSAVLQYEDAHFPEAADQFQKLLQQQPKSPLVPEMQLRLGYCLLQGRKLPEAIQTLTPLQGHSQFADRALWWTARAQAASADPANPQAIEQATRGSIDTLGKAAEKAKTLIAIDPDAKTRRGDILMELGDTQQVVKQYKEAAATYLQVVSEDPKSDRAEEATQRRVTALHLAGNFADSDALADEFQKKYPKSTLLPAVLFRQAENLYLTAVASTNAPNAKPREEQDKFFTGALARYQRVVEKYPEFDYIDLARQGMASCHYRLGHYPEAIALLITIPETSRNGELAGVPYLQADCLIRTLPPEADDALTAERLIGTAEDAAKLLEAFVAANPKSPQAPDAMLKLGYCYQRMAVQMANGEERQKSLAKAKDIYDKSTQQFGSDPSQPSVIFERARCLALMADANAATVELRRFQNDPLRNTPNAPLAILRLSSILRAQGKPQEAVDAMLRLRNEQEANIAHDPMRAPWLAMLQYEHALGLQDLKKLPEARAMFEAIVKQFPGAPEALNANWRIAQCRREEAGAQLAKAREAAHRPGIKPEEVTTAYASIAQGIKDLAQVAEVLRGQAEAQGLKSPGSDAHLRMEYELAWCYRVMADAETDAATFKLQQEAVEKVRANWPKDQGSPPALMAPEVPLASVPMQPSEQKARECYQKVIAAAPAAQLASQARFELAEMMSQRGETDAALVHLATALENSPPPELAQRIKLRVAASLLARNNAPSALAQAKSVMDVKDSPVTAEARYLVGESYIRQQDWPRAIETLLPFRDQDPLRNAAGVADRALARLGYAYAQTNQWEPSRQTYEQLISRFAQSAWGDEARFGMGWSMQNQKRYDEAVSIYADLTHRSASEFAAKAQLNIGVCRNEQKRPAEALKALLSVPLTYDYPECSAAACYEAARAHMDSQQPKEATQVLQRVVKEYPATKWASLAQQRLTEIK
ncbi:MAG: hypothetical protein JWP03_5485 [Phycisphaerales bacterium]|nr:hypothetical protein [Phycisphaerales bacterium]